MPARGISQNCISYQELQENTGNEDAAKEDFNQFRKEKLIQPSSDRSIRIPVEISIKYLQSDGLIFYFYYYITVL
jgi:hypothetical protein